jgi:carbon monoxide dehydrogenase subunit G
MRLLKLAAFSIVILFLVVTAISLLFPSKARVSRATDIQAPKEKVYALVNNISNWRRWLQGGQQVQAISQQTEGKGAIAEIEGSRVLILRNNADTIVTEWIGANGGKQTGVFVFISQQNVTTVNWYFEQQLKWFPWEKFGSMFNDKILGKALEDNLDGLKKVAEQE